MMDNVLRGRFFRHTFHTPQGCVGASLISATLTPVGKELKKGACSRPATEAALQSSVERWGVLVPVARDQHGRIIDGHHRARIADALGVTYGEIVHNVADDDEARQLAITLNNDRRHLPPEQRKEIAAELRAEGHSYRAIGGALGVSDITARRDVSGATCVAPESKILGRDGKLYPASNGPRPHVSHNSGENEWYTPPEYIAAARRVMGGIDTDPATSELANETVGASVIHPIEDSGPQRGISLF